MGIGLKIIFFPEGLGQGVGGREELYHRGTRTGVAGREELVPYIITFVNLYFSMPKHVIVQR